MQNINPSNFGFKGPLLVNGFFKSVLQQHFFTPSGIFDDSLKEILWRPDEPIQGTTDSKIYIGYKLKPKNMQSNFRPAVLVERGDWKREKVAMHDNNGTGGILYGDKIDRWVGSHRFTCLTKTLASIEILAHEVATFFEVYGQLLASQICLEELFVTSISAPTLVDEDNETYSAVVAVQYYHHNHWSLSQTRPKIRHIRPLITIQDYDGKLEPKTTLIDINYNG